VLQYNYKINYFAVVIHTKQQAPKKEDIMAEQVLNQFRSDKALREDCIAIYEAMGMDLNTAFRMFMERTRMVRGLPFPAVLPENKMTRVEAKTAVENMRREAAHMPEITLDEINAEISAVRAERKADQ